ncbi:MAG TPA: GAF domain-containing sensor histidine kinase [Vicinamibacterales bacterium]|jgi:signal transduction histidine kinase
MTQPAPADLPVKPAESDPRRRTLAEQELINSLGWLVAMRWLAGLGVLVATAVAEYVFQLDIPGLALFRTGLFILAYNAALRWWLEYLGRRLPDSTRAYEVFARTQIVLDWLAMTILTALSGGIESPVIVFFLFHITIAALLLPHARLLFYLTMAPALVALLALLEYTGVVSHVAVFVPPRHRNLVYVFSALFFFTVACYVLAYLSMSIAVRLRRREREVSGLYESVRDTTATLDLQTVLSRLVESATRVLACKGAAIRLIDRERGQVAFVATYGLSDEYLEKVPQDFRRARLDQATLAGEPLFVNDAAEDPRIWQPDRVRKEGIESMLSVPLAGKSGPLGVLRAYGGEGHRFSEDDAAFLELVAGHGAVAIENAQAYRMLEELDREKSRFVRTATHELRSPVNVMESLLTALADGYAGALAPEHADVIRRALRRVQALQLLVNDLLDLAAGKAHVKHAERRLVRLAPTIAEVCERFQAQAAAKGVGLVADLAAEPLELWADTVDLDRLATNLVGNAVKYTPRGEVRITLARDGESAKLVVADTGIGIPTDGLARLFEEFYRAKNAKALEEAGTGLGLAIVKDLVGRYAGRIDVESTEGHGTTFTVTLPLAPAGSLQLARL